MCCCLVILITIQHGYHVKHVLFFTFFIYHPLPCNQPPRAIMYTKIKFFHLQWKHKTSAECQWSPLSPITTFRDLFLNTKKSTAGYKIFMICDGEQFFSSTVRTSIQFISSSFESVQMQKKNPNMWQSAVVFLKDRRKKIHQKELDFKLPGLSMKLGCNLEYWRKKC